MAELIPFEYRLRIIRHQLLSRWMKVALLVGVVGVSFVGATYVWDSKCAAEKDQLMAQYKEESTLIVRSEALRSRRQDLADRMQKIQQLMDDRTLLSLLRNISSGFSSRDCLQYINIDARADKDPAHAEAGTGRYIVHITGITENSTTLADLMTRLGKKSDPPINVVLQASKREPLFDGQVMHFEILCEQPETKGS